MKTLDEVYEYARQTMRTHGIADWGFGFDTSVRRFGRCNYTLRCITLSRKLTEDNLDNFKAIENTLLHEIAHALTVGHGHDKVWKNKAIEIGCDGQRLYSSANVVVKYKYKAECGNCGRTSYKHRRMNNVACGKCCRLYNNNKYTDKYKLTYELN